MNPMLEPELQLEVSVSSLITITSLAKSGSILQYCDMYFNFTFYLIFLFYLYHNPGFKSTPKSRPKRRIRTIDRNDGNNVGEISGR